MSGRALGPALQCGERRFRAWGLESKRSHCLDVSWVLHRAHARSPPGGGGWGSGWLPVGPCAEWQLRQATAIGEDGRLLGWDDALGPDSPGRWAWPGDFEHGPDDLATVGGRQNPERAREAGDDAEPSPCL